MTILIKCSLCGTEIQRRSSNHKYCGVCSKIARKKYLGKFKDYHSQYWEKSKVARVCVVCGQEYKSVKESQTCSPACRGKLKTLNYSEILTCLICGKKFKRTSSNIKNGRNKTCSLECRSKRHSNLMQDKKHWNWQDAKVKKTCIICGKEFKVYERKNRSHPTCSYKCKYVLISRNMSGENHYLWRGGWQWYRGENWLSQRKKALIRDNYQCQECGKTQGQELEEVQRELSVHHIVPFRFFNDHKEANRLENLLSLCNACHYKQESHRWLSLEEVKA